MTVIDVHTHMLSQPWFDLLRTKGGPRYEVTKTADGRDSVRCEGAPFLTPQKAHFDYALRIKDMDEARVDVAIVSLTAPNCYFGDADTSLAAARLVNDDMRNAQKTYPDRVRWMASLPWEHPEAALAELKRAHAGGAVGVMVLANINARSLTEPAFAPIWRAIDDLALPVLVHPTSPPGTQFLDLQVHNMTGSVGFMFDTSLAVGRMIFDGFFETYPHLKIIAAHAGAALPYIVGRLDRCFEMEPARRTKISRLPSEYLRRIYYDAVTYRQAALQLCLDVGGPDNLMYGSDYPHLIGDMKGCLARVDSLSAAYVKAVRGTNAQRIFRL
ncbi:MAG TPA: amidohydrolase family protein [Xanthobacteraceae bacterium]